MMNSWAVKVVDRLLRKSNANRLPTFTVRPYQQPLADVNVCQKHIPDLAHRGYAGFKTSGTPADRSLASRLVWFCFVIIHARIAKVDGHARLKVKVCLYCKLRKELEKKTIPYNEWNWTQWRSSPSPVPITVLVIVTDIIIVNVGIRNENNFYQ